MRRVAQRDRSRLTRCCCDGLDLRDGLLIPQNQRGFTRFDAAQPAQRIALDLLTLMVLML
jgi:hypothetical protein